MTTLVVDPTDFGHVLVGSHAFYNVGVLESKDAGTTWILHPPPDSSWPGGSYGLSMLYNPELGIGDSDTWLVHHVGFWLTKNAGATWTQVSSAINGVHGSTEVYYSKTGILYSGTGNGLDQSNFEICLHLYRAFRLVQISQDGVTHFCCTDQASPRAVNIFRTIAEIEGFHDRVLDGFRFFIQPEPVGQHHRR